MPPIRSPIIKRCPLPHQGMALEILGHAIEYLLDSYVLVASGADAATEMEAVEILKRKNLEVFQECPRVEPVRVRLFLAAQKRIGLLKMLFRS